MSFFAIQRNKEVTRLSIIAILLASAGNYAVAVSPSDEAAMNAMKYKIDILGIKLGMAPEEAKKLIQSALPNAQFKEYLDSYTKQPAGWSAIPENCTDIRSCDENITVSFVDGKVWYVGREKHYNKEKDANTPTVKVTVQSLEEKYGILTKIGDFSDGLRAYHSFSENKNLTNSDSCNGTAMFTHATPSSFSPEINWFYSISARSHYSDRAFLGNLQVSFADCQLMFNFLKKQEDEKKAQKKAADEKALEEAKDIKPKL